MEYKLKYFPNEDTAIFHPKAFERAIGKRVPVTVNGQNVGLCRIVAAEVIDKGKAAILTVESDLYVPGNMIGEFKNGDRTDGASESSGRPT